MTNAFMVIYSAHPLIECFESTRCSNKGESACSSWYVFFQLPIAEMAIAHNDFEFIERLWKEWSPGWSYPPSVMNEIKEAFRQPSVLKAALGYYRSLFNSALQHPDFADIRKRLSDPIPVPTMDLHGANDGCIGVETTEGMESAFLRDFEKHIISSAGHFIHQELSHNN